MAAAAAGFPLFILPYENITAHQFRHDQKIGCLALSQTHFFGRLSPLFLDDNARVLGANESESVSDHATKCTCNHF